MPRGYQRNDKVKKVSGMQSSPLLWPIPSNGIIQKSKTDNSDLLHSRYCSYEIAKSGSYFLEKIIQVNKLYLPARFNENKRV